MSRARPFLLTVFLAALSTACDEKLRDVSGPTPDLEPTFSSIQENIFESTDVAGRTACVQCHTNVGRVPAGGLNLLDAVAYQNLVNIPSIQRPGATRVIPADPNDSYLVRKLEGRDINGVRMPFSGPPYLTDGQILVIRRWIQLGANND